MAQHFHLEEFEQWNESSGTGIFSGRGAHGKASDTIRVTFYEQGYKAGWDDAVVASQEDQASISAELAHNLQDLGFTFHEARSHIIHSLEPLLQALVEKLLPELFASTLAQRILEEIASLVNQAADTPIHVVVAPCNRPVLEAALANATCPLVLMEEPSLSAGQVYLRSGRFEKQIDLDSAISTISEALTALSQDTTGAFAHG